MRMIAVRQWHAYLGAFIAPSVLFFASTGLLQLFSLHESRAGYQAPVLLQELGSVHKDQVFEAKAKRPPREPARDGAARHADADPDEADHDSDHPHHQADAAAGAVSAKAIRIYALKWVFAIVAVGLIVSTLLGLWMALTTSRRPSVSWMLLLLGAALPILLLVV